jgi:FkbM family methyltransferase
LGIFSFFKGIALKWLPEHALQFVKKVHYARAVHAFTLEDEPELKIVCKLVKTGDCVIDIGANIGVYTRAFSDLVGQKGLVYSIEPVPVTFSFLKHNVKKLGLANVEAMNVAISDSNGTVKMEIPTYASGGHNFYRARVIGKERSEKTSTVDVQCVTIDSKFFQLLKKISFIKCDVEGHELACLKGAQKFLSQTQAAWLIEVSGNPEEAESPAHEVFDILMKKGYSIWWFDGDLLYKWRSGDLKTNYFFLKPDHVNRLKELDPNVLGAVIGS